MSGTEPTDEPDDLRAELQQVDRDLARIGERIDELRAERADPDSWPDTSDDAIAIRELEDEQTIRSSLEARRAELLELLDRSPTDPT